MGITGSYGPYGPHQPLWALWVCLVGWLAGWLVGWLVVWAVGWLEEIQWAGVRRFGQHGRRDQQNVKPKNVKMKNVKMKTLKWKTFNVFVFYKRPVGNSTDPIGPYGPYGPVRAVEGDGSSLPGRASAERKRVLGWKSLSLTSQLNAAGQLPPEL
jgi:hypothetical protein